MRETELMLTRADHRRAMMIGMFAIAAAGIVSGRIVVGAPDAAANDHRHRPAQAGLPAAADCAPLRARLGAHVRPLRSDCRADEQDAGMRKSPLYDAWAG